MKKCAFILFYLTTFYSAFVLANEAIEPSFNCKKASTQLQHIICRDSALAELDQQLDFAYDKSYYSAIRPELVEQERKQWLKELEDVTNKDAIKNAFQARLEKLSAQAEKQFLALKQTKPFPVVAIKYFRHNQNKAIPVRINSYFIKKKYNATFDGLSSWLIDDDESNIPVASYTFSRIHGDLDPEMSADKVKVDSCASYDQAIKHGYDYYVGPTHPGPEEDIHYDLRDCKIISLFKKAKPAKLSYLRDFNVDQFTEKNLLALTKGFFDEFTINKIREVKFYPATYLARLKLNESTNKDIAASIKILGWADFTGTGLDSLLVEVFGRSYGEHGRVTLNKIFIITRKQPNAPLEIVKQVDEISL